MGKIKEKFKDFPEIYGLIMFILIGVLIIYITNNLFSIFAPFIIAYIITIILRPMIVKLKKKLKIPNNLSTIICLTLFLTIFGLIMWAVGYYISDGIEYLIGLLSSQSTVDKIMTIVDEVGVKLEIVSDFLHINVGMNDFTTVITDITKGLVGKLSTTSINIATQIPNIVVSIIIGCVAAFYMLFDYDRLSITVKRQMSIKTRRFVRVFNEQVLTSLIKMILSYAFLSIVCFIELLIGFKILGINDAVFIALLIAIFDVLPVVGSGGILTPWGIIAIIMGDTFVGIGLIVLWGIIVIVRQILEPKIVGTQVGLHPLITVATLYIGLKTMGGLGLIIAPLYIIVCKKLNEEGLIKLYKLPNKK